jgi:hypothetical protein
MGSSWRRFNFFSEEEVGYLDESTACCGLDDGGLARGDSQGVCHLLDPTMRERCAFAAHERGVTHLLQPRGSTLLFSLGLELEGAVERTFMRVWRPEAAAADGTAPCLRHVKLFERPQPEPAVTCWCVADDLTQVVCGLGDGTVLLLRSADLLKERYLRFKALTSFAAPAAAPVTAVHLSHLQRGGAPAELFVLTADAVFSVSGAGLRHETRKVLAEAGGAAPGCSCLSDDEQLVVGTAQVLYTKPNPNPEPSPKPSPDPNPIPSPNPNPNPNPNSNPHPHPNTNAGALLLLGRGARAVLRLRWPQAAALLAPLLCPRRYQATA